MPTKKKSSCGRSTNGAMMMRLFRNNHSQTHDQNVVEDEINTMFDFNYNKPIDYRNIGTIENMNLKCNFYHALKWSNQPLDLCCSRGKVLLAGLLIHRNHQIVFFIIFLYDSCLQFCLSNDVIRCH